MSRSLTVLLCGLCWLATCDLAAGPSAGAARAQAIGPGPGGAGSLVPRSSMQAAPPMSRVAPTVPPDTVLAQLSGPEGWPEPTAIHVWPDTVAFGEPVWLVLDFPAGAGKLAPDSLTCSADWWVWADRAATHGRRGPLGWLSKLAAVWHRRSQLPRRASIPGIPEGLRLSRQARVLHAGAYRVAWGPQHGAVSPLGTVTSRLDGGQKAAPIRPPLPLGWSWSVLFAALLALLALIGLLWRLWRRGRRPGMLPADVEIPPPAYLQTARDLWRLHQDELPAKGQGRLFLDRLAGIVRAYVSARYRVRAAEMTAGEVACALTAAGHGRAVIETITRLLQSCDDQRYGPGSVGQEFCRGKMVDCVRLLQEVRIEARFAPVPARLAIDGGLCWSHLQAFAQSQSPSLDHAMAAGGSR
jgi:hypothetical protein